MGGWYDVIHLHLEMILVQLFYLKQYDELD